MDTQLAIAGTSQHSHSDMFASPETVKRALEGVGYTISDTVAATICFADFLKRPVLQEGPAGSGKTEMAVALSRASGMPLIRLQCYEGITDNQAIGEYSKALQDLFVLVNKDLHREWDDISAELVSRKFYIAGPLLQAIEAEKRVILLIDEIDKVPRSFEAMLLQLLSVWQLSITGLGDISAQTIPFTILTSNAERELGDALRRRSLYLLLEQPPPIQQAQCVAKKTPTLSRNTHLFIAAFAEAIQSYPLEKTPAISEMNDLALIMEKMGWQTITPELREILFPVLIKRPKDLGNMRTKDKFADVIFSAMERLPQISLDYDAWEIAQQEARSVSVSTRAPHIEAVRGDFPEVVHAP